MKTYTCEHCHEAFESTWSEDEAKQEAREMYGPDIDFEEDMATVCDDCYQLLMAYQRALLGPSPEGGTA